MIVRGRRSHAGFTLIELIVVVAVIAIVATVVGVGVGNIRGANVDAEAGKLAIAVRYLYNMSVLNGRNYRLVVDLDKREYWGEEQTSGDPCKAFLFSDDDRREKEKKKRVVKSGSGGEEERTPTEGFQESGDAILAKRALDPGISFGGVMTSHQSDVMETGQAEVNFFPNGTTESAYIYVQGDEDDIVTVEILPLQGKARVHREKLPLSDFYREG